MEHREEHSLEDSPRRGGQWQPDCRPRSRLDRRARNRSPGPQPALFRQGDRQAALVQDGRLHRRRSNPPHQSPLQLDPRHRGNAGCRLARLSRAVLLRPRRGRTLASGPRDISPHLGVWLVPRDLAGPPLSQCRPRGKLLRRRLRPQDRPDTLGTQGPRGGQWRSGSRELDGLVEHPDPARTRWGHPGAGQPARASGGSRCRHGRDRLEL